MSGKRDAGWLAGLCLLAALLALAFARAIPPDAEGLHPLLRGLNPDENDHFDYVRRLWEEKGFVVFQPRTPGYVETYQSPLYYLLCVPVFALSGGSLLAVRLVAVALQAATVWVAGRAAADLFPGRREIALGTAAIVALLPTQAQLSGAVNNDSLTTLVSAALFWRLGRLLRSGQSVRGAVGMGLLIGVGLLTKLTVLQLLPVVLLGYALAARASLGGWGGAARRAALALGVGFAVAAPWLIRNTYLYGDPFTLKIFPLTAPLSTPTPAFIRERMDWSFGEYVLHNAGRTLASFFYILPPNGPPDPRPGPLALVGALALLGAAGTAYGAGRGTLSEAPSRRVALLALAAPWLLLPFFVRFNLQFFQAQGRYFYPALLPAALALAAGLSEWAGPAWRGRALAGLGVLLFLLSALQAATRCQAL